MSEAQFSRAAVAAPHGLAARAGRDVLAQGGNAIEAMVAMAATIAVVYPQSNALGGDGFWLIREPSGKVRAIEACGFAGAGATPKFYRDLGHETLPLRGPLAALTTPGAVAGWARALELAAARGGKLPLRVLLEHAEGFARGGFPVSGAEARFESPSDAALLAAPGFRSTFFIDDQRPKAGELRKFPALAETFAQLAHAGLDDFHRGDVGREIAADLERLGSPVTRDDVKTTQAYWREPLSLRLRHATLYNTPAPTQGLASLMILGLYERLGIKRPEGFAHVHGLIEATKRAFAVRDEVCVDFRYATADFEALLSHDFLDREAAMIDRVRAGSWPPKPANGDTIWMGAIDDQGLAVSFIQSIYWEYGSGVVLPKTGILMANRGVAFSLDPSSPQYLRPGRRPFHTLNPPLAVFDDGRVLSYGTMGGDGQPQYQAQVFTRIAAGEPIRDALAAPRHLYGRAWGRTSAGVKLEDGFDDSVARALEKAGHLVERRRAGDQDLFGHAGGVMRSPNGAIEAEHDARADGGAEGF